MRRRWKARFGAQLNCLQGHRWHPIAKSGNIVRRAYSRTALDCKKTTVLCFLHRGAHFCLRGVLRKRERFDVAARSETSKPSCQSHKHCQLRPHSGPSKEANTRTKDSEHWANIEKRHQINTKNQILFSFSSDKDRRTDSRIRRKNTAQPRRESNLEFARSWVRFPAGLRCVFRLIRLSVLLSLSELKEKRIWLGISRQERVYD